MKIKEIKNLPTTELACEIEQGGRFIVYTYCISIGVMTFKRLSAVYFLKPNESPVKHGWPFLLISTVLGWWGIPLGPVYTIQSIYKNFSGTDVTTNVLLSLHLETEDQKRIR